MSANDNLVPLSDRSLTTAPGEPVQSVVELCERMLADAMSGDLRAVGVAVVRGDYSVASAWGSEGGGLVSNALTAAASGLFKRLM